jgi:hypothetical protein
MFFSAKTFRLPRKWPASLRLVRRQDVPDRFTGCAANADKTMSSQRYCLFTARIFFVSQRSEGTLIRQVR